MSTADWEKILLAFGYLTSFDKYSDSDWSSDGYAEYLCNTCNAGFASITQLKVHATPSNSTATNCKLVFVKQRISQLTQQMNHDLDIEFLCNDCRYSFKTISELISHASTRCNTLTHCIQTVRDILKKHNEFENTASTDNASFKRRRSSAFDCMIKMPPRKKQKTYHASNIKQFQFYDTQYSSTDKILFIGEMDFSLANAIASEIGGHNITATAYYSSVASINCRTEAIQNINSLKEKGAVIELGVDGTNMSDSSLRYKTFDKVIFGFPYSHLAASGPSKRSTNAEFIRSVFRNVKTILNDDGEFHLLLHVSNYSG
eukprot:905562_1